jgi:uncharacterized protein (DUF885 family)
VTGVTAASAPIGELAEELARELLREDPFRASMLGLGGDAEVPDLSPGHQRAWRDRLAGFAVRCGQYETDTLDAGGSLLLEVVRDRVTRELADLDSRVDEFAVTPLFLTGPSLMLLVASRARVHDPDSAAAYLTRCTRLPGYLDQCAARVRAAAGDGLLPVAPLVSDAIAQVNEHLSHPERDPMLAHRPPADWPGGAAWRDELDRVVRDDVRPAMVRYADTLAALLPKARPGERAGLLHLPGGVASYACCVRIGTTLPLDPDELHRLGLTVLAETEERIAELGGQVLGLANAAEVMTRLRRDASVATTQGDQAMAQAVAAITRAQERSVDMFHAPLPAPCAVDPMPTHLAESNTPPFYTPPSRDGGRAGAYMFNSLRPGQAGTWALEATAFHEALPGHHAQFSRLALMPQLPLLLSAFSVVPHSEGWGLYAERLADEFGLYSDDVQRLGMLSYTAWRAVRLVVDSGLHARGWSRQRAREFALTHSPMPEAIVNAEIDRYIAMPGQALGYLVGQREILRLRDDAKARLGAAYDLRDFHSAVLDHGSLPLTLLRRSVESWVAAAGAGTAGPPGRPRPARSR